MAASFQGILAADWSDRAGTAEFQYLETLIFARPAGLAGANTSVAQGEDAVGYNPAGLSRLEKSRSLSGTIRHHLLDVTSGNVTYAFPGAFGMQYAVSAAYVNYGGVEGLDEEGNPTGQDIQPTSINPSLTASRKVSERLRLGATLKAPSEYLGDFEGSKFALGLGMDAGLLYHPGVRNLGFGLSLLNLGSKLTSHVEGGDAAGLLPVSLKGGFYYIPSDLPKSRLIADLEVPWHDSPLLSGALEYAYSPALVLRAGSRVSFTEAEYYLLEAVDRDPGVFEGGNALKLAGGFTFQAEGLAVDYAVQYWLNLRWVHALTFRYALI